MRPSMWARFLWSTASSDWSTSQVQTCMCPTGRKIFYLMQASKNSPSILHHKRFRRTTIGDLNDVANCVSLSCLVNMPQVVGFEGHHTDAPFQICVKFTWHSIHQVSRFSCRKENQFAEGHILDTICLPTSSRSDSSNGAFKWTAAIFIRQNKRVLSSWKAEQCISKADSIHLSVIVQVLVGVIVVVLQNYTNRNYIIKMGIK